MIFSATHAHDNFREQIHARSTPRGTNVADEAGASRFRAWLALAEQRKGLAGFGAAQRGNDDDSWTAIERCTYSNLIFASLGRAPSAPYRRARTAYAHRATTPLVSAPRFGDPFLDGLRCANLGRDVRRSMTQAPRQLGAQTQDERDRLPRWMLSVMIVVPLLPARCVYMIQAMLFSKARTFAARRRSPHETSLHRRWSYGHGSTPWLMPRHVPPVGCGDNACCGRASRGYLHSEGGAK